MSTDPPDAAVRDWLYLDAGTSAQRGPISAAVLLKMLEKGVGVTAATMCWKAGMETWQPMASVEPFQEAARFQATQWYFVDADKQQKGPVITRMILHKVRRGEIDGMTLVYSATTGGNGRSCRMWRR